MDHAFPVPEHLPRARTQQPDISTQILTALGESSSMTIQSTDKWADEIDQAILQIKLSSQVLLQKSVHDRLHQESTAFDKQMRESKSVQVRLGSLVSKADSLSSDLTDPEILRHHSNLAQRSLDAEVIKKSLEALSDSRRSHQNLDNLVKAGNLPAAVLKCRELQD
ncbi:1843_t:CDS:2, partial [Acaulospora colombiana]